ncbi:ScyD/ScyE family protein [Cryobacterium sp. 5B3]|uniref:ScyD/ScyE family protein n=1 Tax=Cryobacterium sp. 5B3 TaxID=3048586 RepID=UPI002AB3C7BA|nr:ScyD/ScyE family protein [Cryobacterium sp. 5B3]MDY7543800.1 ScyD/ScyE family protein [Cryobacterium sp. 5B3]MEB0275193.1 ScyD/ScyE family protein [Cryobacterium sp. 5B3]
MTRTGQGTGLHGTRQPGTGSHGTGLHSTGLHSTGLGSTGLRRGLVAGVACASLAVALFGATPATAGQKSGHDDGARDGSGTGTPVTLAEGLLGPLSLEVGRHNTVYVTQNFKGELTKVARDGTTSTLASAPGEEISAVTARKGTVYYARVAQDHSAATLRSIAPDGTDAELADIAAYEKSANPDQNNSYGIVDLDPTCAAQFDPTQPPLVPATYTGVVDTHPYASLALWNGVYVADAGGNAILHVDWDGTVSTTAVLPPSEPVTIDAAMIADIGFPACAAGHEYRFEPVPTDVELGPDGWLYVTSLPGGPEDASLGARGSVYRVDPDSGEVELVATGFVGATGLAVSQDDGTIYVAELFGGPAGTGQVSVLEPGSDTPSALVAVSQPAAIELRHGALYLTTDAITPDANGAPTPVGKLVRIPLTGGHAASDALDDTTD